MVSDSWKTGTQMMAAPVEAARMLMCRVWWGVTSEVIPLYPCVFGRV
jgi:hypothetical protein